jgi:predicted dinucleotide-binding enzyme
LAAEALAAADVAVITTPWPEFGKMPSAAFAPRKRREKVIIDPWQIIDAAAVGEHASIIVPGRWAAPAAAIEAPHLGGVSALG